MEKFFRLIPLAVLAFLVIFAIYYEIPMGADLLVLGIVLVIFGVLPSSYYTGEKAAKARNYIFAFFLFFTVGMYIYYVYVKV